MKADTYEEAVVFNLPGMVARVYRPILDAQEREKRMKAIHKATADVLKNKLHN